LENLIEVDNVSFAYTEGIPVLKNVTFSLNSGSVFGQAPKGIKETTAAKLAKTVGLVFQNPNDQIFKNKVLDEVMFGPLNIGQSVEENAIRALETVSLVDKKELHPYDIVIFDEPTIAQDWWLTVEN